MPMPLSTSDITRIKRLESKSTEPIIVDSFSPYSQTVPALAAPNNAGSTVFVISCIDPRFTSAVEEYLLAQLAPGTTYDLFVLAGGALGGRLVDNTLPTTGVTAGCPIVASNKSWKKALLDHIQVAITLHNIKKVYIIDHLGCGAYGACGPIGDTPGDHWTQFNSLRTIILAETYYANGTGNGTPKVLGSSAAIFGIQATGNIKGLYFSTPVGSTTQLFEYTTAANAAAANPGTLVGTYTFPSSSGAKVLVLGCIDPRFSQTLSSFLINYKEVQFVYDLFILAGSSLGVNQSYQLNGTQRPYNTIGDAYPNSLLSRQAIGLVGPVGENWGPVFFDHLALAVQLHGITEVWVFDHLDCGAYKNIKLASGGIPAATDLDPNQHIPEIQKLQESIRSRDSSLGFKGFIMDTNGLITQVADNKKGIVLDVITYPLVLGEFGSSRIRSPASEIIELRAKASADYVLVREHSGSPNSGFGRELVRTKLTPVNTLGNAPSNSSTTVLETKVGPLKSTLLNRNRL